ncbi:MAG: ADP-ribosylglycohydrolase family protein [Bacteroidales bacterium]|nr:ADP-ribosylglycohydrolase family protein [Bacteroidales bacterium]MBN2698849.1 ADP-ribosylglycohydrolase family protein [Bacteroidales bacterium]
MKRDGILIIVFIVLSLTGFTACNENKTGTVLPEQKNLSHEQLMDKIKGGWAGQTIGVVYGAPVEFKYQGSLIPDYQLIPWNEHYVKYWWDKKPGLFDDVYTDLNFVSIFERNGLDVSIDTIAHYWAETSYHLAHANQASRYNILNGILPPASGYWKNNPHADDIDFQIESDFIGLMAPGMVNQATEIADRVGHIMNSGDGWYGGVYVSAIYSLAFVCSDVNNLVNEAVKTIPEGTQFRECMNDVISWHRQYPDDWRKTWFEVEKKWNRDVGCPKGVYLSFNIDAKINSAYVTLALLYGKGDFTRSVEIATRCGQDADCNPATAGGVLGVMNGYSGIPQNWLKPLQEIEALYFEGTTMSLAKAYDLSFKHAKKMIIKAGGEVDSNQVIIPVSEPVAVKFEQNFENCHPIYRDRFDKSFTDELSYDFTGNGFIFYGNLVNCAKVDKSYIDRVAKKYGSESFALAEPEDPYVAILKMYIDGSLDETIKLPMKNTSRRLEPAWKYQMEEGKHNVKLVWLNPDPAYEIRINDIMIYSEKEPEYSLPK